MTTALVNGVGAAEVKLVDLTESPTTTTTPTRLNNGHAHEHDDDDEGNEMN